MKKLNTPALVTVPHEIGGTLDDVLKGIVEGSRLSEPPHFIVDYTSQLDKPVCDFDLMQLFNTLRMSKNLEEVIESTIIDTMIEDDDITFKDLRDILSVGGFPKTVTDKESMDKEILDYLDSFSPLMRSCLRHDIALEDEKEIFDLIVSETFRIGLLKERTIKDVLLLYVLTVQFNRIGTIVPSKYLPSKFRIYEYLFDIHVPNSDFGVSMLKYLISINPAYRYVNYSNKMSRKFGKVVQTHYNEVSGLYYSSFNSKVYMPNGPMTIRSVYSENNDGTEKLNGNVKFKPESYVGGRRGKIKPKTYGVGNTNKFKRKHK